MSSSSRADPTNVCWVGDLPVPGSQAGRVLRLVVIERDQAHSEINDTGAGAKRIVYVGTLDLTGPPLDAQAPARIVDTPKGGR